MIKSPWVISAALGVVLTGCQNLSNQPGATLYVEELSADSLADTCNFARFQTSVAAHIQSNCVTCHAGGQGGFFLPSSISTLSEYRQAYRALISKVETTASSAQATDLVQRVTDGSALNHPFKLSAGAEGMQAIVGMVDEYLFDPTCAADPSDEDDGPF